jgi:hypothetical protein
MFESLRLVKVALILPRLDMELGRGTPRPRASARGQKLCVCQVLKGQGERTKEELFLAILWFSYQFPCSVHRSFSSFTLENFVPSRISPCPAASLSKQHPWTLVSSSNSLLVDCCEAFVCAIICRSLRFKLWV